MLIEEYRKKYSDDDAPGWLAIDAAVKKIYLDQEPKHWAAVPHFSVGGQDPIDGISFYEAFENGEKYYHFVTYGFSSLYYDESLLENQFSKFGFELTFRLKPYMLDNDGPKWVFGLIQNIARYVFNSGKWFEEFHYMPANGPIRLESETKLTAIAFVLDPQLGRIETPHGEVQFLQMYGITDEEYRHLKDNQQDASQLFKSHAVDNPMFITDLMRER